MASENPVTIRKKNQIVCVRKWSLASIGRVLFASCSAGSGKWVSNTVMPARTVRSMAICISSA